MHNVWFYPKNWVSFSNTVVNQELHESAFCGMLGPSKNLWPSVGFYVQSAFIPLSLFLCRTKSHTKRETGRKGKVHVEEKKEMPTEDSETERMEWEKREENEQEKYNSLNQKDKKFIRISQRERERENIDVEEEEKVHVSSRERGGKIKCKGRFHYYLWGQWDLVNVSLNRISTHTTT